MVDGRHGEVGQVAVLHAMVVYAHNRELAQTHDLRQWAKHAKAIRIKLQVAICRRVVRKHFFTDHYRMQEIINTLNLSKK